MNCREPDAEAMAVLIGRLSQYRDDHVAKDSEKVIDFLQRERSTQLQRLAALSISPQGSYAEKESGQTLIRRHLRKPQTVARRFVASAIRDIRLWGIRVVDPGVAERLEPEDSALFRFLKWLDRAMSLSRAERTDMPLASEVEPSESAYGQVFSGFITAVRGRDEAAPWADRTSTQLPKQYGELVAIDKDWALDLAIEGSRRLRELSGELD